MKSHEPALNVKSLTIGYIGKTIAQNVSFALAPGSLTALMGPNGAGKSTLIQSILGLIPTTQGTVTFFGSRMQKVRARVAYVPQRSSIDLNFPITAREAVTLGTYPRRGFGRPTRAHDRNVAAEALERMRLTHVASLRIGELSGGQLQRVFLARALAQQAELFILDEPLTGVDHASEHIITQQLRELSNDGKTVLAVHHNISTAPQYFNDILLFDRALVASGPSSEVIRSKTARELFGGSWNNHSDETATDHVSARHNTGLLVTAD